MPISPLQFPSSEGKLSLRVILTGAFIVALSTTMFLLAKSMQVHHFFSGGH